MPQSTLKPEPETRQQESLEHALGAFVGHLETAQTLWRRYPSLVEADQLPERFLAAFRSNTECKYGFNGDYSDSILVERGILTREDGKEERIKEERIAAVISDAKTAGERQTAETLVGYTRTAFKNWLCHDASALDLYLLEKAFSFAESERRPLADVILELLGKDDPSISEEEEDAR